MSVAALILAAGRSTRMGSNKMCAELDGKPLVRHVAEAALASQARPVIVVTGHEQERVRQALSHLALDIVHNPAFAEGLASSLKTGVAALPQEASGVVVLLGDMPFVSAATIDALIEAHRAAPAKAAVVPLVDAAWGNPVLIGQTLFDDVERLCGDRGARALLLAHRDAVIELPVDEPALLVDIDTPDALRRAASGALRQKKGPA
ncbi:MAG: nucleotidyltransferase family protein [Beijerinckiaceae bacterium]|nr:nucleotidyltransferase family protein [Beijerinckiaceae bacterium]